MSSEDVIPLHVSIEMAANLVYLAQINSGNPERLQEYLERASEALQATRGHPGLKR